LKILDSLAISVENLDAGWTTFLSSDEYLGHYVGGTVIPTKAEVTDSLKVWFSDRESQQFKTSKVSVTVLTENLVLVGWLINSILNLKMVKSGMEIMPGLPFLKRKIRAGRLSRIINRMETGK
jgi:hypothetical protein